MLLLLFEQQIGTEKRPTTIIIKIFINLIYFNNLRKFILFFKQWKKLFQNGNTLLFYDNNLESRTI